MDQVFTQSNQTKPARRKLDNETVFDAVKVKKAPVEAVKTVVASADGRHPEERDDEEFKTFITGVTDKLIDRVTSFPVPKQDKVWMELKLWILSYVRF